MYDSLVNLKQFELPYISKWQNIFTDNNLEWDKIWGAIHESICDFKVQSSIWQMAHLNFISAYFLKKVYNTDGKCKLCGKIEINRIHIFIECEVIKHMYEYFHAFLNQLYNEPIDKLEMAFGIFKIKNDKIMLRNYLMFIIRHVVFKSRNCQFTSTQMCKNALVLKIKNFLKRDLESRFIMAKTTCKLELFEKKFLVDNIFGNLINETLFLNL